MASTSQEAMQTAMTVVAGKQISERNLVQDVSAELNVNWRSVKKYAELGHTKPESKPRGSAIFDVKNH